MEKDILNIHQLSCFVGHPVLPFSSLSVPSLLLHFFSLTPSLLCCFLSSLFLHPFSVASFLLSYSVSLLLLPFISLTPSLLCYFLSSLFPSLLCSPRLICYSYTISVGLLFSLCLFHILIPSFSVTSSFLYITYFLLVCDLLHFRIVPPFSDTFYIFYHFLSFQSFLLPFLSLYLLPYFAVTARPFLSMHFLFLSLYYLLPAVLRCYYDTRRQFCPFLLLDLPSQFLDRPSLLLELHSLLLDLPSLFLDRPSLLLELHSLLLDLPSLLHGLPYCYSTFHLAVTLPSFSITQTYFSVTQTYFFITRTYLSVTRRSFSVTRTYLSVILDRPLLYNLLLCYSTSSLVLDVFLCYSTSFSVTRPSVSVPRHSFSVPRPSLSVTRTYFSVTRLNYFHPSPFISYLLRLLPPYIYIFHNSFLYFLPIISFLLLNSLKILFFLLQRITFSGTLVLRFLYS